MAQDPDIRLLTSPRIFLVGMAAFLALVGFVVLILYQQIALAFSANPGLNGLILGVLAIGALFTFRQVIRLFREIHWVNSLTGAVTDGAPPAPRLLAPMAVMLNAGRGRAGLVDHHDPRDPRFHRHAARRGPRAQPLSGRAPGVPWAARHVLGSVGDGAFDRRRHRQHEDRGRYDDHVRRPQARPVRADRRHERLVHLLAVRPREFVRSSAFSISRRGRRRTGSIPSSRNFSPATSRRRRSPRRFRTRRSSPRARSPRSSISATPRRSRRSPRAFRLWSATCAPNSSKFAIGSTRRRRSRKTSASSCGACWTNWARATGRSGDLEAGAGRVGS